VKTKVIFNPAAGRGAAGRNWPQIERELVAALGPVDVATTLREGDESRFAATALAEGYEHFIAVGGDGTLNGIVNELIRDDELANPNVIVTPMPCGTANETARELGYHGNVAAAARTAANRRIRRFDILKAECAGLAGHDVCHYGVLAVSWGSAAEISYRTSTSRYLKKLGGRFSYYAVTLLVTLSYEDRVGRLKIDDRIEDDLLHYTGLICNTQTLGGGMKLAPGADPQDGIADLLLFRDIKRRDILLQKPSWLFEGRHIEHEKVDLLPGKRFSIEILDRTLVDADGETIGHTPLTVTVLPGLVPFTC
jgi:YegS/Rv2252/BmrU family lipid kinase